MSRIAKKILVVDDETDLETLVLQKFRKQIKAEELQFIFAHNGLEALGKLMVDSEIEMLVTDINMPEMDGLTLISKLSDVNPLLKAVVVTAYGDMENIRRAMNHGAFDFLNKPIDFSDLEVTIQKTLKLSEQLREGYRAMEEKLRIQGELHTASFVQMSLLPKEMPIYPHIEISGFFQSAVETAGDWYGLFTDIEGCLYLLIGDVNGHGIPSALITAAASSACRMIEDFYVSRGEKPAVEQVLNHLNHAICDVGNAEYWMTFCVVSIDLNNGAMSFANAGHTFPLLLRKDEGVISLLNSNACLGYDRDSVFQGANWQLQQGDVLFLYTDGLTENRNRAKKMWGLRNLIRCLKDHQDKPLKALKQEVVLAAYNFFEGNALEDDITFLSCQIKAPFPQN